MKEVTVGVDIGGTNSVLAIVDKDGNILAENKILTTDYPKIDDFVFILFQYLC